MPRARKPAPRGWGQVRPFGDGYQADIRVGGERFRPVFPTAGLAERFLEEKRAQKVDVKAGRIVHLASAPDVTYADAIAELREQYAHGIPRVLTRRTLGGYRLGLDALSKYWTGAVGQTTTSAVDAWIGSMRRAKLASSTIRHLCDRLSAVHQLCVRRGWLAVVPCAVTRPRLVMASEVDALPEADYARVLGAAKGDRQATAILLLAGDAGLRVAEIWRLEWPEVRWDTRSLHVRVWDEKRRTKSGKGRDLPLTPRLRAALAAVKRKAGPVVPGTKTERAIVRKASGAWRDALGGPATLHRLRHRYGTQLAANGVHVTVIMLLMGHAKIETTMRYIHAVPEVGKAALYRIGRATGGQRRGKVSALTSGRKRRRVYGLGEVPEWLNGTVC